MKKFAKGCLITALSMLAIGFIILIIYIIIGGTTFFHLLRTEAAKHEHLASFWSNAAIKLNDGEFHIDFSNQHPIYSGEHENMQIANASSIKDLNIDLGGVMCTLSESSDEYFHIITKNADEFQYYIENETLYIKGLNDITFGQHLVDYNEVYLEVPKNFSFEDIDLEVCAGCLNAHTLTASDTISIKVGAGEFIADSLTAQTLSLEAGAGDIEINNADVSDSCIALGMGSIAYNGIISGDLEAECGMGALELFLLDSYDAHNYNVDCTLGEIKINNTNFNTFAHSTNIDHGTDSTYTLTCGMGNINIQF